MSCPNHVGHTGRMLNRFSKDIETVDSNLASSLQAVNSSLANFFVLRRRFSIKK